MLKEGRNFFVHRKENEIWLLEILRKICLVVEKGVELKGEDNASAASLISRPTTTATRWSESYTDTHSLSLSLSLSLFLSFFFLSFFLSFSLSLTPLFHHITYLM